MPEATDATLTSLVEYVPIESLRIEALRETADSRYLGVVGVSFRHPIFHASFSGELSPDSRYVLRKLSRPGHETMVFVLFRQFDSSRYQAFPEDIVAGWVPPEQEDHALGWVQRMNRQIEAFGVTDDDAGQAPVAPTPAPAAPTGADAEPVYKGFALRTRFAGTAQELVEHVERRLGLRFHPSDDKVYDGQPAFEAADLGMTIRLVEFPPVASCPRRFNLTGYTEWREGVDFTEHRDVTSDMQARLGNEGVEWYVPSREELNTEAGL